MTIGDVGTSPIYTPEPVEQPAPAVEPSPEPPAPAAPVDQVSLSTEPTTSAMASVSTPDFSSSFSLSQARPEAEPEKKDLRDQIEGLGSKGPISAEQAADFSRQLESHQNPEEQKAIRDLIAEAQTPLLQQRLGIESESRKLDESLKQYGELEGPIATGNFARLRESMGQGKPFNFLNSDDLSKLSPADKERYAALNQKITEAARQDLREGQLSTQLFAKDFAQVKNLHDTDTLVKANQASARQQPPIFPNFSEKLADLERRQTELNQAYEKAGLAQRSDSEDLTSVRDTLEIADDYLRTNGQSIAKDLGQLVSGQAAFEKSPVEAAEQTPASDRQDVSQELKTFQDLRNRGIAPADIQLSPQARQQMGMAPAGPLPQQILNPFQSQDDKPLLYGDSRGADLSQANLNNYNTGGEIYDKDTRFPSGFNPAAHKMVKQLNASEDYQAHLAVQPDGLERQYSTRVLEQAGQFPNPNYDAKDSSSSATVDGETFHKGFSEKQMAEVESKFNQERAYVDSAGGYERALQGLRDQAAAAHPSGRGGSAPGRDEAFQRLVEAHMPHHYAADQKALEQLNRQAVTATTEKRGERPPTQAQVPTGGRGVSPAALEAYQEKKAGFEAYQQELARLKSEQGSQLRERNLQELRREQIQSAANVDRDELDRQWAKVEDSQLHSSAGQAWQGLDIEQRRQAMSKVAAERIEMTQYQNEQLVGINLRERPQDADETLARQSKSQAELQDLSKALAAGKVEEVDAQLRQRVVPGSAQISHGEMLDTFVSKEQNPRLRSFEQNSADMQAKKEEAYKQNGWWEDSPFSSRDRGAFLQDLQRRDLTAISPNDARRGLETLQELQKSGQLDAQAYQAMQSKLSRAYDLGRVGQATAILDKQFGQMVDDQGLVGDFANFAKNSVGRPGGWVIDSNLGSEAINGQLQKAHAARESLMELSNFQGSDAEFREKYQQRLGQLQDQVKSVQTRMGEFDQSQQNWVEGISDLASVSAGLALAPVTGGASLVAVPLATAAVKVGVKAFDAASGNQGYQGNIALDLVKGGLNGGSALATSKVANLAEKAFMAGRTPGVASWMGSRLITAGEGAVDGFVSGTGGALVDGKPLDQALQHGATAATVGLVFAPAIRTAAEVPSALRQAESLPAHQQQSVQALAEQNVRVGENLLTGSNLDDSLVQAAKETPAAAPEIKNLREKVNPNGESTAPIEVLNQTPVRPELSELAAQAQGSTAVHSLNARYDAQIASHLEGQLGTKVTKIERDSTGATTFFDQAGRKYKTFHAESVKGAREQIVYNLGQKPPIVTMLDTSMMTPELTKKLSRSINGSNGDVYKPDQHYMLFDTIDPGIRNLSAAGDVVNKKMADSLTSVEKVAFQSVVSDLTRTPGQPIELLAASPGSFEKHFKTDGEPLAPEFLLKQGKTYHASEVKNRLEAVPQEVVDKFESLVKLQSQMEPDAKYGIFELMTRPEANFGDGFSHGPDGTLWKDGAQYLVGGHTPIRIRLANFTRTIAAK